MVAFVLVAVELLDRVSPTPRELDARAGMETAG
jgi:hypothetical protein